MRVTLSPMVQSVTGKSGGVVFQNVRGNQQALRFRKSGNPRTEGQVLTRSLMRHSGLLYSTFDDFARQAWDWKVEHQRHSGCSVFTSAFMRFFRGRDTLADFPFIQSDRGAAPPGFIETEREFPGIRITLNDFPEYQGYRIAGYLMYLVRAFNPGDFYEDPPVLTRWLFSLSRGNFFIFPPQYDFYAGGAIYYVAEEGEDFFYSDAATAFVLRLVG